MVTVTVCSRSSTEGTLMTVGGVSLVPSVCRGRVWTRRAVSVRRCCSTDGTMRTVGGASRRVVGRGRVRTMKTEGPKKVAEATTVGGARRLVVGLGRVLVTVTLGPENT